MKPDGVTDEQTANNLAAQFLLAQAGSSAMGMGMGMGMGGMAQMQSMGASMQQTRHARRIYVGGIGDGVSEQELSLFFSDVVGRALQQPGQPPVESQVVSTYINHDRHFGFVELKSIELTTACMQLDGLSFKGQQLKVRRPNDYNAALVPPHGEVPNLNLGALGIVSTSVPDSANKIFIGGLPYHLAEPQVRELLEAFGPLRAFHLVRDTTTNTSKGYGFCEYSDGSVTDKAVEGLNDLPLGDKTLTVRRAVPLGEARVAAAQAGSVNSALSLGMGVGMDGAFPGGLMTSTSALGAMAAMDMVGLGAGAAAALTGGVDAGQIAGVEAPTRVLSLSNMVQESELLDDAEFADIVDDVRDECSKYGAVRSVAIPRPGQGLEGVGKVFVEFEGLDGAVKARGALAGRQFAGRSVMASYVPEDKFAAKDFA